MGFPVWLSSSRMMMALSVCADREQHATAIQTSRRNRQAIFLIEK